MADDSADDIVLMLTQAQINEIEDLLGDVPLRLVTPVLRYLRFHLDQHQRSPARAPTNVVRISFQDRTRSFTEVRNDMAEHQTKVPQVPTLGEGALGEFAPTKAPVPPVNVDASGN